MKNLLQFNKLALGAGVAELADAQDLGTKTCVLKTKHLQENKAS
jgi:hypothetical protein